MSNTFDTIRVLIAEGKVRISEHGYDELVDDGLLARELIEAAETAEVIEDYPNYPKGPCVLVLHRTKDGRLVHAVWGIALWPHKSSSADHGIRARSRKMGSRSSNGGANGVKENGRSLFTKETTLQKLK